MEHKSSDKVWGEIKEYGHFLNGTSGYAIWEVEATDILGNYSMLVTYHENEIHEIIPVEKSYETMRAVLDSQQKQQRSKPSHSFLKQTESR